jgi:hypothetical protein
LTATDLDEEMGTSIKALTGGHVAELRAAGVDPADIDIGLIGTTRGRVEGDLFAPDDHGGVAFVTPVRTHYAFSFETPDPASALRIGDIVDLVFWHPRFPRASALRTGAAEVLGLLAPQYCEPEPVEVWRGPLSWFCAGCRGLVLLSRNSTDIYRVLSMCTGGIISEDEAHARELTKVLEHPWPHPPVTFRQPARTHHVV